MVAVGRAWWLISLFKTLTPGLFSLFDGLEPLIGSPIEAEAVESVYAKLPAVDFSRAILAHHPPRLAVKRVKDVYWSDWGNPAQVEMDLTRSDFWPASRNGAAAEAATAGVCA
jgi:hypothetical protein